MAALARETMPRMSEFAWSVCSHGHSPPRYLVSPLLARLGLPHLFTTRHFPGVTSPRDPGSPFDARAFDALAEASIAAGPPAYVRQMHGAEVVWAERDGLAGRGDIVTTGRPGLPLAVFTADCVPIVLYDPEHRRLALAHAGWRGTAEGAARAATRALTGAGGRPEVFAAAIGPSIGPCCYEIDAPVIERLQAGYPESWRAWVTPTTVGKWMLDLGQANADQLMMEGLDAARIDSARLCTSCRADLFFSYRRARAEGRLVAVATLPTDVTSLPARAVESR